MLTVATRIKILAFLVISVLVIGYIGTGYADLGRYVGLRDYYTVKLGLSTTGGLFEGSAVSYRGIVVGKVGKLTLTHDGVVADLRIKKSAPKIPRDLKAIVANRSAVGEQYVDLRPDSATGPFLANGVSLPSTVTTTPTPVAETLKSINDLTASVPLTDLQTVINELGLAFAGQGPHLQKLLDTGGRFVQTSDQNFPTTRALLYTGTDVLRTQNEEAASLKAFASNSRLFARGLRDSDADFRRLIDVTPSAAREVDRLVRNLDPGFGQLLANLLTTSRLTNMRLDGIEDLLSNLPRVAAMGSSIVADGSLRLGLVNTFFNPQPCTRGYGGTQYRKGENLTPAPPLNTNAHCAERPGSGMNVRGSANAPHRGVPDAVQPGDAGRNELIHVLKMLGLSGVVS
ncbi:MCE family protein [Actinomadura barringtoniae]|uniref:MCE family protein n=1 Tax=Actinomadura barringtoniae TaxID=1427535 RepID=A0A939P900_9ACTN|nr:MlaD family protein [Actinomadura barringtoniae]MBO2447973.1 MCE family protein [Actinomadura barringtoniae]